METKHITIPVASVQLGADLCIPPNAFALVIMGRAHQGSRFCDSLLRSELQGIGIATLNIDLLLPDEGEQDRKQYNIELLTERLIATTHWLQEQPLTSSLALGYYGSGLEAATALRSAAGLLHQIKAMVICEGDLTQAMNVLHQINAPTLLIAKTQDQQQYQEALDRIEAEKQLRLWKEEDHQEEPQRSAEIAAWALKWYVDHFQVVA
ncbi:MAG: hypothetical protein OER04_09235 [Cyclobacteriaceae bacterium]|nr:hypothetical protein [Cyclobacteriaceae bacterium]